MDNTIYWFHEEWETDPYTQGYIGITQNWKGRLAMHRHDSDWFREDLKVDFLHEGLTRKEALDLELHKYRPTTHIGLNKQRGGGAPPVLEGGGPGAFKKGHTTWNKGLSNSGFKQGYRPHNRKFDDEFEKYFISVAKGKMSNKLCEAYGISYSTLRSWRAKWH